VRIAFDGTPLQPPRTGVAAYAELLLTHLAAGAPAHQIDVFSHRPIGVSLRLPAHVRVQAGRWPWTGRTIWLQTMAPSMVRRLAPDVVHFTTAVAPLLGIEIPVVLTVHDMSMTWRPQLHPPRRRLVARRLAERAIRRADAIVTHSEHGRRDILRLSGVPAHRVHVIPAAAAPEFRPVEDTARTEAVRTRYGLAGRIILCVGTIEPRKNLVRLAEAFARLRRTGRSDHQLVIVGPAGWQARRIRGQIDALRLGGAIRFTGVVPPEDLPLLYTLAEIVVFPSLYEGFGLPVAEAMACGRPVVASSGSAVTELVDTAAELVDPSSVDAIAAGLLRVTRDADWRHELAARALVRARAFSWEQTARRTLAVYEQVAGR
jgi:glycosyltransferase involved in cell wall biosynthesis